MKKELYGKTKEGKNVYCYTISNKNGMEISVLDFGAILQKVIVPDKNGKNDKNDKMSKMTTNT